MFEDVCSRVFCAMERRKKVPEAAEAPPQCLNMILGTERSAFSPFTKAVQPLNNQSHAVGVIGPILVEYALKRALRPYTIVYR